MLVALKYAMIEDYGRVTRTPYTASPIAAPAAVGRIDVINS